MDVLLPFNDEFTRTDDIVSAVGVAAEKAEGIQYLQANFDRATYGGEASGQQLPYSGAWAFHEFVAGLASGLGLTVTN
ncbi:hypothetical protein N7490_011598 [Penicillium lividum]|nr:hypothetical protein N7490_011598 [Penicillium lividum]